jgi:CheY-like chemotaxis protein
MVIEDDLSVRETIQDVLEVEGFQVTQAANGQEALDHLRSGHPRVILLDLMMPVMDGWQFRDEMRRDPSLSAIPVVVMSADAGLEGKAAGMDAVAVLQKPITLDRLLETVHRLCA